MCTTENKKENPTKAFESAKLREQWLAANHAISAGLWLRILNKEPGEK